MPPCIPLFTPPRVNSRHSLAAATSALMPLIAVCTPGSTAPECVVCAQGTYRSGTSCLNCPAGFTTNRTGATAASGCSGARPAPPCLRCVHGARAGTALYAWWASRRSMHPWVSVRCAVWQGDWFQHGHARPTSTSAGSSACTSRLAHQFTPHMSRFPPLATPTPVCLAGYGGSNCGQCVTGTRSAGGPAIPAAFAACPPGKTTPSAGATSLAGCTGEAQTRRHPCVHTWVGAPTPAVQFQLFQGGKCCLGGSVCQWWHGGSFRRPALPNQPTEHIR